MRNHFASSDEIARIGVTCRINDAIATLSAVDQPGEHERAEASRLCPDGGPVLLSEGKHTLVSAGDSHSVCFASTGRGKTRRHVYPMMLTELLSGSNVVVNDMKGEILETMRPLLDRMGYVTHALDLRKPAQSPSRYNPLSIVWDEYHRGDRDASFLYLRNFGLSLFDSLGEGCNDPFWTSSATDYFVSLALGMLEWGIERDAFTLENVAIVDREGSTKSCAKTYLQEYFELLPGDSVARQFASGTIEAPNDTRLSILSVFRQPMSLYLGQQGLTDALSCSDFTVADLTEERRALFIVSPDETHALGPIVVGIINQVMSALVSIAQSEHGGRLPRRVDFILDEFGNLPSKIPDMGALVSAARSRNIRLHLVLQSEHQLAQVYGHDMKEVILDNVDTWYFMGSRSYAFMKHLSDLAGETTLPSGRVVPLISVSQMQHLESRATETETLIFASSLSPYVTALRDVSTYAPLQPALRAPSPSRRADAIKRPKFDIKGIVQDAKERKMREMAEMLVDKDGLKIHEPRRPRRHRKKRDLPEGFEGALGAIDAMLSKDESEGDSSGPRS